MTSALPQELIDDIVDHLHDNPSALGVCSLTNPIFLDAARTHLFRAVSLSPFRGAAKRCAQLEDLLANDPALTRYIQHLRLVEDSSIASAWLRAEVSLPSLLRRLADARSLAGLYIHGPTSSSIVWNVLPVVTQAALIDIISSPSMRTLRLERVTNLPYQLLHSIGPFISQMVFLQSTLEEDSELRSTTAGVERGVKTCVPALSLASVQVETAYEVQQAGNVEYLLQWLAQREAHTETMPLKQLSIVLRTRGPDTHDAVNALLARCTALESLALYPCPDYSPPAAFSAVDQAISVARLSMLRDVTLGGAILRLAPLGVPRWLVRAFELLPAGVDHLRVDFVGAEWRAGASGFADWEAVDEALGAWAARARELRERQQDAQPAMLLQPITLSNSTQIELRGRGIRRMVLMGAPPRQVTLCLPAELRYTMLGYERLVERIWLALPRLVTPGVVLDVRSGPGRATTT